MNRRDFLRIGGTTLFGLSLPDFFRAQAAGERTEAKAKQMICIWLGGGPPHRDMFDLKPDAPAEFRGEFKPIQTNVPGIQVSELLPRPGQAGRQVHDHSLLHDRRRRATTARTPTTG